MSELRLEMNKLVVRVTTSKKDLRKRYNWTKVDWTYLDAIIKFCKEWLFCGTSFSMRIG